MIYPSQCRRTKTLRKPLLSGVLCLTVAACVQPYTGPSIRSTGPVVSTAPLVTQDQTAGIEEQDRINRFRKLANIGGIAPPNVQEITLPPGSVDFMQGPVPVVRVVFPERTFFAFDSDTPLPSADPILDVIAMNMQHDVPDAALTVLGHTDAIGGDAYNIDLSRRRAENVMRVLVARGMNPDQLSEVAIGKRQPIAPNETAEGRALNRRVEFLISPSLAANLTAVKKRDVPGSYFSAPTGLATEAAVYKLKPAEGTVSGSPAPGPSVSRPADVSLAPAGTISLNPVIPAAVESAPVRPAMIPSSISPEPVQVAPVQPMPAPKLAVPEDVKLRPLGPAVPY
jgi:outer membrane protein OmpA-like peptidoglycan-associated protein